MTAEAFITAAPETASIDQYVDLAWGNLPKGRTVNLYVIKPDGDGGTIVVDTEANSGYQYPVTAAGTWQFQLVQGKKVVAETSVSVS